MKKLLKYFRNYRLISSLAPLFKLLEALMELSVPLIIVKVIDDVVPTADRELLIYYIGIMFLIALVSWLFAIMGQLFAAKSAVGFTKNLTQDLFKKTLTLSQSAYDELTPGSLTARITNDTYQIQTGLNLFFRLFLRSPFIVAGSLLMASRINTRMTIYFIGMTILLSLTIVGVIRLTTPYQRKIREKFDDLVTSTREQMKGLRVIRAFRQEEREEKEFEELNWDLAEVQKKTGYLSILTNPLTFLIVNVTLILLIWDGSTLVDSGTLSQGEIVALVNYLLAILIELAKLVMQIVRINRAWVSAGRIEKVLARDSESEEFAKMTDRTRTFDELADAELAQWDEEDTAFLFNDVDFQYPIAEKKVLKNIQFEVQKNSRFGIIGGTGSGKTTVLNLISNIYLPSAGEIIYDSAIYKNKSREALRDQISIVSGEVGLFKGTIRSNLLVAKENATEEEMWQALDDAQAKNFVLALKEGLDAPVEAFGQNFSGGQKQRLTIARALLKESEIIILDDSTSALDYLTEANFLDALAENYQDRTVIIVSQRTRSLENADQILVLDAGDQVGLASHEELLKDNTVYREIHESQLVAEVE
ncbi:MAG: ABC transporter ATP-binding protein/permease [Atopostipes sp.]|nr:ABC transporter ATP-binding protein/permease [Atopostipes sp.]